MTVGIVGLGLIGGSLARSIKVHTDFEVLGMDINPQTMLQANLLGAIDGTLTEDNLAVKRPGTGISPMEWEQVVGQVAVRDFEPDELIEL